MSEVVRKHYGGVVNWCDTQAYKSCVKFVHAGLKTESVEGKGVSLIIISGTVKLYSKHSISGNTSLRDMRKGDSESFYEHESFYIEAIDESHFLQIEGK